MGSAAGRRVKRPRARPSHKKGKLPPTPEPNLTRLIFSVDRACLLMIERARGPDVRAALRRPWVTPPKKYVTQDGATLVSYAVRIEGRNDYRLLHLVLRSRAFSGLPAPLAVPQPPAASNVFLHPLDPQEAVEANNSHHTFSRTPPQPFGDVRIYKGTSLQKEIKKIRTSLSRRENDHKDLLIEGGIYFNFVFIVPTICKVQTSRRVLARSIPPGGAP
ncbi:hypothetical protein DFH29DRAFT_874848 [Suillus ampliporus]|nr:hypothetical protein DFH29DRAFT_874848 [Suillus ampliporus]